MVDSREKNACSGCFACQSICPLKCISMCSDSKGFLYPQIDYSLCIHCGACDSVCDKAITHIDAQYEIHAYGAFNKDEATRMNSSSGGVFTLLAERVIKRGGIVVGAALSDDVYGVNHVCAETVEEISEFRGSKYLQSRIGNIFEKTKKELLSGRTVLFSGTPCQVSGLKAFLGVEYENLLSVDFICHGVPSEKVWRKYCREVELKQNRKISNVNFRLKKYSWVNVRTLPECRNCKAIYHSRYEDPYIRLFLDNYTLRPSCYECKYKGIHRPSDITIADFWGVNKVLPQLSDGKGTSLIVAHTEKGNDYIKSIMGNLKFEETDVLKAIENNEAAVNPAEKPDNLDDFWENLDNMNMKQLAEKYTPISLRNKVIFIFKKTFVYAFVKRIGRSITNMEYGILFLFKQE